jgi:maltose O-acetyltransferase
MIIDVDTVQENKIMTELEKCMAGEWYDCHDPVFLGYKNTARALLLQYNVLPYDRKTEKGEILAQLFGSIGKNVSVGQPFICDYGRTVCLGSNVSINMNCTFVDCNRITIGNNVLIASNVQIYTATHPVERADRLVQNWDPESGKYFCHTYALPVTIGNGCWLGGGVIVLPGVTIGDGTVIGAGSVVTKNIEADCVAVGNPCRIIRRINGRTE